MTFARTDKRLHPDHLPLDVPTCQQGSGALKLVQSQRDWCCRLRPGGSGVVAISAALKPKLDWPIQIMVSWRQSEKESAGGLAEVSDAESRETAGRYMGRVLMVRDFGIE